METDSSPTAEQPKPPNSAGIASRPTAGDRLAGGGGVPAAIRVVRLVPVQPHKGWTVLIAMAAVGLTMLLMLLWLLAALLFRWRFQYSLRSLLLLVVAVAIPCSWLAVEMKGRGSRGRR